MIKQALWYCEHGYSIFPITPGDKDPPLVTWKPYQKEVATKEQIIKWWHKWPKANIGLVTGRINNLCVVDLDKYKPDFSEEIALKYFPNSIVTTSATSPRGGFHLYFKWPGEEITGTSNMGGLPSIDFRCDGNYIVAPPSANGNGNTYSWVSDLELGKIEIADLPRPYLNKIKDSIYRGVTLDRDNTVTSVTECDIWKDGVRDENLYHVALCLAKTKNDIGYIRQTLRAIIASWGEKDDKWIDVKIKSALERCEDQEKNIQDRFDSFVRDMDDPFSVTQLDKEIGIVTQRDMATRRKCISRRKDKTIEKLPNRPGWYRRIETELEFMDFEEPEEIEHPLRLPFDLHSMIKICQGNIVVSAGEYNSGKTTFSLNCLVMNKNRMPIRYISSEMKVGEIKSRFKMFGLSKEQWWPDENCQYLPMKNNLPSLLLPDGLNIIDYLEFPDGDYTMAGEYVKQIHDKLRTGVAIVCIQKKEGQRLPRSGDMVLEKPRLAITFTKIATENENVVGIAEILKAKNVRMGKMDGKRLKYEIIKCGSTFKTITNWGWWR